ncbi:MULTISPECIES: hypothetical protein [unclassified Nesterenkonia]|nr:MULTISPECIES: hypothetical protein [unclassified Nesterenkonia]MCH8560733.1 hypothetical protein [Nesterenkonia sp. DZ6]MCH8572188.1 hypothetical protein [Nesterenkonia sp. AY15]
MYAEFGATAGSDGENPKKVSQLTDPLHPEVPACSALAKIRTVILLKMMV